MSLNVDSVGGELLGKDRGHVVAFSAGRVCTEEGCHTRLSIYNSRTRCAAHDFDASLMNFRSPSPAPATSNRLSPRASSRLARSTRGRRKRAA
jgi:hypothetical protein